MVQEQELINVIVNSDGKKWDLARHRAADMLLSNYNSELNRDFIWSIYKLTKDYYYCSILKIYKSNGK